MARHQLSRDLDAIQVEDGAQLSELIDYELVLAALDVCTIDIRMNEPVFISSTMDQTLIYRDRVQQDFSALAQRYGSDYYNAAYALGLRYSYLRLTGHGLARAYRDETKRSPDCPFACECFASAFNHYFDRYYSAFPDLEMFFGSRGCFFKAKWEQDPEGMTYYVCPPFDESLMQLCADHVLNALNQRSVRRATFVFAIPGGWTDFHALEQLKRSPRTVKIIDYPEGLLPFIDHMAKKGRQIVYPTDICELVLTNILPSSSRSSSIR